jgi:3-oxoacyl-(acyl-carrier-protein) synthase
VTCWGSGFDSAWDALVEARPAGRDWLPDGAVSEFFAAPLPDDYRPLSDIPRNLQHMMDRGSVVATDAALQALAMAGLGTGAGDARRFAVADGQAYRAPGQATLFAPYGHAVARVTGVRGPVVIEGGAEASGMAAIAAAVRLIARGDADVVLAGAAQALQEPVLEHLRAQGFAAKEHARPLDVGDGGLVPAEGAAYFVLESKEFAEARGASTLATVAGVGATFDPAAEPLATSLGDEAGRAMQSALGNGGYLQNQVDHIISCADGRPTVDASEAQGIMRTFGRHAYYAGISTVAATFGHALAASGPLSVAYGLKTMRRNAVAPIHGFTKGRDGLDLTYVTETREEQVDCVLVNSLGLGGTNVSILLQQ